MISDNIFHSIFFKNVYCAFLSCCFPNRMWAINVKPVVNISQVVAKKLIEANQPGSIVNVSSQASLIGMPKHTSYGASKGK